MSTSNDEKVLDFINKNFDGAAEEVVDFRGERTIVVEQEKVHAICKALREDEDMQYNFLIDIVADDMLPEYPRFAVSYHLRSMANKHDFRLRAPVEDPDEGPQTVGDIWNVGSWLEIEVYDLMGITFKGNKELRRLFLPEDWVGHPLRKDYPLGYEEVQFSFNWKAIQDKKPYAGRTRLPDSSES